MSFVASLLLIVAPSLPQEPAPPFEAFATEFRKAHQLEHASPEAVDVQGLLARDWLCARIGAFDVLYPRAGLDAKPRQEELRAMVGCMVDLQALWLEWFGNGAPADAARADLVALKRWLNTAKPQPAKLATLTTTCFDFFGATEKENAALERVVQAFQDGSALGYKAKSEVRQQILFAPTRKEFLDVVAFFGWVDPDYRGNFWVPGAARWSECFWNATQVLCLQDLPGKPDPLDPWAGASMNAKDATGAVEHVSNRSAHTLCNTFFGYALDPAFEGGLCQNAAIALYGRNNARSGGSGRGNSVDGWSMFVPGGQSKGGVLPGMSAESAWRSTFGAEYFLKPLRDAQRLASKDPTLQKDKHANFQITSLDTTKRMFVRAPFFGQAALEKEVPPTEFLPDYLEFFRAYKSAFVHWLQEEGAGKTGKPSRAKLAEFLRMVAAAPEARPFQALLEECYGKAWSAPEPKPENLEWGFLMWLSRQK